MKKEKAVLNLYRASASEVKLKADVIVNRLSGNLTFATPSPALTVVQTQIDILQRKLTEQEAAFLLYQQKSIESQTEKDNTINILETLGNYVETTANGEEAKIISAGYDIKKPPTPIGVMDVPVNVLAVEGNGAGALLIKWKAIKGAKSYNVEQSDDITKPAKLGTHQHCYQSQM